jgi:hypothetical protein
VRDQGPRLLLLGLAWIGLGPGWVRAQDDSSGTLPTLKTTPVLRSAPLRNLVVVDSSPLPADDRARRKAVEPQGLEVKDLPKDQQKFWILDFAFKPVRMVTIETPKGRRQVYYLFYRVINHTGKPRTFVPQFTLVTDDNKAYPDTPLPRAVQEIERREKPKGLQIIQAKEGLTIPLYGAVDIVGILPPSGNKEGVDDAVYGVAVWEMDDAIARADSFKIYVRGLSDGSYTEANQDGAEETRYKTLRIDFTSPGDERDRNEGEIHLLDPPYTWEYLGSLTGKKPEESKRK